MVVPHDVGGMTQFLCITLCVASCDDMRQGGFESQDVEHIEIDGEPLPVFAKRLYSASERDRMRATMRLPAVAGGSLPGTLVQVMPMIEVRKRVAQLRAGATIPRRVVVAVDWARERTHDESVSVRKAAAEAIMHIGPDAIGAEQELKSMLIDPAPRVRIWAARALYQVTARSETPLIAVVGLLDNQDPDVREMAINTLERMREDAKPALPALAVRENDTTESVRRAARRAAETISKE